MVWWVQLLWSLAITVVAELLRPKAKPQNAQPSALDDFDFPTAEEGRAIPVVWGDCLISGGNVTWYGDLKVTPIKKKQKTGLWSSKMVTVGFKYSLGVEMMLAWGEIEDVPSIRVGNNKITKFTKTVTADTITFDIDEPNMFGGDEKEGGVKGRIVVYKGTQTQTPNAYMEAVRGKSLSAYRGVAYAVLEDFYLGTSAYIKPVAFEVKRRPNSLGLASNKHQVGDDANPACMVWELLTNQYWGCAIPEDKINKPSLLAMGNTCHAEGLGLSMLVNGSSSAQNIFEEILRHADGVLYTDPQSGEVVVTLSRKDYDVATLPVIGESNVRDFNFSRGSWSETKNTLKVTYTDRAQDFTERVLQIQDLANVQARGGEIVTEEVSFLAFATGEAAGKAAARSIKTLSYPLARASFVANRTAWTYRPGSVFKLNWPALGIDNVVYRVLRIEYGTGGSADAAAIKIDAVEDIFFVTGQTYVVPPQTGWVDPLGPPQPVTVQHAFEAPYQLIPENNRYGIVVAQLPSQVDEGADIWFDAGGGYVRGDTMFGGTPSGVLELAYPSTTGAVDSTGFTVRLARGMDDLTAPTPAEYSAGESLALITSVAGSEIVAWSTITKLDTARFRIGGITRGVLDTVPLDHPLDARVWLITEGQESVSNTAFAADGTVQVKLLTRNARGTLDIASASPAPLVLAQRAARPYPAANLRVEGSTTTSAFTGDADISWAIRHRLRQAEAGVIVAQNAASYAAEPEGGYTLRVYINNVLRRTVSITAAPFDSYIYTVPNRVADDADTSLPVRVTVQAVNGTLTSVERSTQSFYMTSAISPLTITTTTLPDAAEGSAYSQALAATGGAAPRTWSVFSGALPAGMALSAAGALTGTPTAAGSFSFTARVTDAVGTTDDQALTLLVTAINVRTTEAGDTRTTESGDIRTLE